MKISVRKRGSFFLDWDEKSLTGHINLVKGNELLKSFKLGLGRNILAENGETIKFALSVKPKCLKNQTPLFLFRVSFVWGNPFLLLDS